MKTHKKQLILSLTLVQMLYSPAYATDRDKIILNTDSVQEKHFDKKGKNPSKFTVDLQNAQRKSLPFQDKRDFEEANKGFIAAPSYKQIIAEAGNVAWDMGSYEFLLQGKNYDSIHPSLQRQAILNMAYGLYEVVPGKIYQIRGFDLANISFIKSDKGWIIFDPLTAKETAKAALNFINEKLGERPVMAVVYSHSHADHYGGVHGVVDELDVKNGKVPIIAPIGFMDHAIAENVYAGNAMNRRLYFQFGILLPRSPFGHVDQSIGKNTAVGNVGLIEPTRYIEKDFETLTIDGVTMEFQNTPGTEAPSEMNTWFPEFKAFWAAENITSTIHNIYTLRGALVRDALAWSQHINNALYRYGTNAEYMFAAHTWPRWGKKRIQEIMRTQRDSYAHLNNNVLYLANKGVTINEIHNVYTQPESLHNQWAARSYHGSIEHNSRAVMNRYLGYWDANPTTLMPLSPYESAPLYVEMMGGSENILNKSKNLFEQGKYFEASEILNKLVYANPQDQVAKDLLADVFEQIGYQKESPSLRNSFLGAAYELRNGMPTGTPPKSSGPDTVRSMSTSLWLNYLGIRLDSEKADGLKCIVNLVTPDNNEKFVIEMSNSTLTNIKGYQAINPDLTIVVNRSDLESVMGGIATFDDLIRLGKAKLDGNRKPFDHILSILTSFTPNFELLPGTKPTQDLTLSPKDPFDVSQSADSF
jgi:alkyl sulfatase BDS1-like metallo-beta-lactamase superfamily hydrolase